MEQKNSNMEEKGSQSVPTTGNQANQSTSRTQMAVPAKPQPQPPPQPPPQPQPSPSPQPTRRDPSLPTVSSIKNPPAVDPHHEKEQVPCIQRFAHFIYNKQEKSICERSLVDWPKIIGYAIIYLLFLTTWTMILLYIALAIIKNRLSYEVISLTYEPLIYGTVGLTAVPLAVHNYPVIWYPRGEVESYEKYLLSLDKLLAKNRTKRSPSNLGPCGSRPYGYGDKPCVVVKINKTWFWKAKPLQMNSTNIREAPSEVKSWLKKDSMNYWLHCKGYHSYDKEHIGKIKYYPYPPGFDSRLFPLNRNTTSPMVAVQFVNFTIGISLAVECKLWFENGHEDLSFLLYVTPEKVLLRDTVNLTFSHL